MLEVLTHDFDFGGGQGRACQIFLDDLEHDAGGLVFPEKGRVAGVHCRNAERAGAGQGEGNGGGDAGITLRPSLGKDAAADFEAPAGFGIEIGFLDGDEFQEEAGLDDLGDFQAFDANDEASLGRAAGGVAATGIHEAATMRAFKNAGAMVVDD